MTIANRFRLMRQSARRHGIGVLCDALGLGIPCAIKFVEGEWRRQPEMVARFEREAKSKRSCAVRTSCTCSSRSLERNAVHRHGVPQASRRSRLDREGRLDRRATHGGRHVARALTRAHR